jgi:hypothetical protein
MELAFAGLHQLCAPIMHHAARLPEPQRSALMTAFGISSGSTPDRFLVGLAVLGRLSESGRGAATALHRRRPAVARPRLGAGTRVRGTPVGGRSGRGGVRHARVRPDPGRAAGARARRTSRRRRPRRARIGVGRAARRASWRPDHCRDAGQPARSARAAANSRSYRTGRRIRAARYGNAVHPDRGQLPSAAGRPTRPGPTSVAAGRG